MDMEGVTCLIFIKVPDNLLSLKFPSALKKLVFTLIYPKVGVLVQQLPLLLTRLPYHVEKIEVPAKEKIVIIEESFPDFTIEFNKGIHLL